MAAQPGADLPFQVDGSDEFVKKHLGDLQAAQGLAVCHGVLEKATRVLGLMAATWATVILLGGFAATLEVQDFYVVTCILLVEAARALVSSTVMRSLTVKSVVQRRLQAFKEDYCEPVPASDRKGLHEQERVSHGLGRVVVGVVSVVSVVSQNARTVRKCFISIQIVMSCALLGLCVYRLALLHQEERLLYNQIAALYVFFSLGILEVLVSMLPMLVLRAVATLRWYGSAAATAQWFSHVCSICSTQGISAALDVQASRYLLDMLGGAVSSDSGYAAFQLANITPRRTMQSHTFEALHICLERVAPNLLWTSGINVYQHLGAVTFLWALITAHPPTSQVLVYQRLIATDSMLADLALLTYLPCIGENETIDGHAISDVGLIVLEPLCVRLKLAALNTLGALVVAAKAAQGLPCRTCVESSFFNRLDQEAPQAHLTEIDLSGLHPALRSAFELARDNASLPWKPADVLTLRFGLNKPL